MTRTYSSWLLRLVPLACLLAWVTLPLGGQTGAPKGEWRTYGGDLGNTRYSPLDQINATNFKNLEVAWRFKTDNLGPRPEFNLEGTPLDGERRAVRHRRHAAVGRRARCGHGRAAVGARRATKARAAQPRRGMLSGRGSWYWTDGREERILYVTPGYRLVALNAKTGDPVAGFGSNGVVDLKLDNDQEIDLVTGEIGLHATPVDCQGHRRHRRGAPAGRRPARQDQREGLHPRLRRAHRQAPLDLPHHSRAGRIRQRHVGEGFLGVHRQRRRLGPDGASTKSSSMVYLPVELPDRRLLRRQSARRRTVRRDASSRST